MKEWLYRLGTSVGRGRARPCGGLRACREEVAGVPGRGTVAGRSVGPRLLLGIGIQADRI